MSAAGGVKAKEGGKTHRDPSESFALTRPSMAAAPASAGEEAGSCRRRLLLEARATTPATSLGLRRKVKAWPLKPLVAGSLKGA